MQRLFAMLNSGLLILILLATAACGGEAPTGTPAGPRPAGATSMPAAAAATNTTAAASGSTGQAAGAATSTTAAAPAAPTAPAMSEGAPTPTVAAAASASGPPPFVRTSDNRFSTFGLDVDTGSYTAARSYLNAGQLPPPDTVRIEEFVNYFHYDYPDPQGAAFGINVDAAPAPFGEPGTQIVRIGVQGQRVDAKQRKSAALTFVIDVSGSMAAANRLPLVKEALTVLVNELREGDQVAIVTFDSAARVVLPPTGGDQRDTILAAIDSLQTGGSTYIEDGLRQGYALATAHFKPGAVNRIILCSDGGANVGATGPAAILQTVHDYTTQGIVLTTVGFGMDDYRDDMMEQLADKGNGVYAYVDSPAAAQRIFVDDLSGTLQPIAKDAKVQVEFNPAVVSRYRLLGYENRALPSSDFRNDTVVAGAVGAGHSATALYEVTLTGQGSGSALTVSLRWTDPPTGQVRELQQPLASSAFGADFAGAAPRLQLAVAVAGFAEQLQGQADGATGRLSDVLDLAQRLAPALPNDPDVQEFAGLVARAASLRP